MKSKTIISAMLCIAMTANLFGGCSKSDSSDSNKNNSEDTSSQTVATTYTPVKIPAAPSQVVNASPCTYESIGADETKINENKEKIKKNTNLPVVYVSTKEDDEIVSRDEYTSCVVDVFNSDSSEITQASAGIRVRGNSTAYYGDVNQILRNNDVPYRIKFDEKTSVLGLNDGIECKSWVLLKAQWNLLMDNMAFSLADDFMGDDYYHTDSQLVNLYVNGELRGLYCLCGQNQVNKNRVDVNEPKEDDTDIYTGYFFDIDNYAGKSPDDQHFTVDYGGKTATDIEGTTRQFVETECTLKSNVTTQQQVDFIKKYVNNVFSIIYSATNENKFYTFDVNYDLVESDYTNAKDTISAVIDLNSVVDMYMLYEMVHDYDCGEGSFYMAVDFSEGSKYPKLTFTAPWDFNWAYNDSAKNKYYAAAFTDQGFVDQNGDRTNPWFVVLGAQPWFTDMVKEKWQSENLYDAVKATLTEKTKYLTKYNDDLNAVIEYSVDSAFQLVDWVYTRADWLNTEWSTPIESTQTSEVSSEISQAAK